AIRAKRLPMIGEAVATANGAERMRPLVPSTPNQNRWVTSTPQRPRSCIRRASVAIALRMQSATEQHDSRELGYASWCHAEARKDGREKAYAKARRSALTAA